ncbi:FAD-dependent oxidoreductase [Pandoraea fibrosis]|uniref:FAD-dependent oxidoreductase n=1 Tax=Pandoraea fibrosis TaxID=1891094 RepID=A0ABX6HWT5_9BURK|nr:FAD-dependent oxidoreductase [Pandoraea fibrosis]QHE91523.1 FAD-dependent oxidoreductase [Pandoraea fibrosis]QHF14919.1 FAD-dependent oxidoreductase [Pandoraea fibrosis]
MEKSIVVVGGGHAAGQLLASLAQKNWKGPVTVIGDEAYLPYQRPPLSKKYLAGELGIERLYVKPAEFYARHGVQFVPDTRVVSIDRDCRDVCTEDGRHFSYATLVLATGSRPRPLTVPGAGPATVSYLRTIDDVEAIRARFVAGHRLVIVGGGYIGLELAAVAVRAGLHVIVLEGGDRIMARGVGPATSEFFMRSHCREGVEIRTGAKVLELRQTGGVVEVVCESAVHEADLVVAGVGAIPNDDLARQSGLKIGNGIVVDDLCRTSDPAVFAVGDCADHPNAIFGRRIRLESVHNAVEQAKTVVSAIVGSPVPYCQVPWFWSDQYELKLQIAGLPEGYEQALVRGDPNGSDGFAVLYLRGGTLLAAETVNRSADFMAARQMIAARIPVDTTRLIDPSIPLPACAISAAAVAAGESVAGARGSLVGNGPARIAGNHSI